MKPIIRYWGRKAGDIAQPYILKYSRPNEIVLDPFGGAGTIIKTALLLGRKGIYVDLNPLATLIAKVEIEGVNQKSLESALNQILRRKRLYYLDKKGKLHWMPSFFPYRVKCKGGVEAQASYFIWKSDKIVAANAVCESGAQAIEFNNYEEIIAEPAYWFPKASLRYSNGIPFEKKRNVDTIQDLFTKRNLLILSAILNDIKKVKTDERTRRGLLVAFASILYQASKMSRQNGGSWGVNSYWIPKVHAEHNPYLLFRDSLIRLSNLKEIASAYDSADPVLKDNASLAVLNSDARELPLPDNSIHMIITDPPFTDEVQYFELSYMAAAWLRFTMPFEKEIIVNRKQGKNLHTYYNLLSESFAEMFRVLKPGRSAIIMLHEENESILKELMELISGAGFRIKIIKNAKMIQRKIGDRDPVKGRDLLILICEKPQ